MEVPSSHSYYYHYVLSMGKLVIIQTMAPLEILVIYCTNFPYSIFIFIVVVHVAVLAVFLISLELQCFLSTSTCPILL